MIHPDPSWCARLRAQPQPPRPVDRVDFDPLYDPDAPIFCELCGYQMHYTGSCKIRCNNCGYQRDCSDP